MKTTESLVRACRRKGGLMSRRASALQGPEPMALLLAAAADPAAGCMPCTHTFSIMACVRSKKQEKQKQKHKQRMLLSQPQGRCSL